MGERLKRKVYMSKKHQHILAQFLRWYEPDHIIAMVKWVKISGRGRPSQSGRTPKELAQFVVNLDAERDRYKALGKRPPLKWALRDACAAFDIELSEATDWRKRGKEILRKQPNILTI